MMLSYDDLDVIKKGLDILRDSTNDPIIIKHVVEAQVKLHSFRSLRLEDKHITEEKYPEMTARFVEITNEMYKIFLEKNNDYSRWNILGTGIVGLATRFWDKTARIMNLVGFDIGTGEYITPKKNMVEDENIERTFLDASVYGIIARIYLEGKWGK